MGKIKPMVFLAGVVAIAGLTLGCPDPTNPQRSTGEISGRAFFSGMADNSGIIITVEASSVDRGAQVALLSTAESKAVVHEITDSSGKFLLSGIQPGTYAIYASSPDSLEKAVATSVTVVAGQRATAGDLALTPVGDISGTATLGGSLNGNLGILVYLAGTSWSAVTTDAGSYRISGVPSGTGYQLVAVSLVSRGYEAATTNVDVTALATTVAPDLVLQPGALITFDSQGGTAVASVMPGPDGLVDEPAKPFKDGFHFSGWFKDAEATQLWNFDEDPVVSSIILYAGWISPPASLAYTLVNGEYSVSKGAIPLSGVVAIPDFIDGKKVTSIAAVGFQNCTAITQILLPSPLTAIGANAFSSCSALARVDIPDGVTTLGNYAFSTCSQMVAITLPRALATMGTGVFSGCASLASISHIPDSVTAIPDAAFSGCVRLTKIELPAALTTIGNNAFTGCSSLAYLDLPAGLASIGASAFMNCQSLVSLSIPIGVIRLLGNTFSGCSSLANLNMPGVAYYGNASGDSGTNIFNGCSSLRSLTIPSGVTAVPLGLCQNCSSLSSVIFPLSITSIGDYAFYGTNLSSLNLSSLPSKVSIGVSAFYNCGNLMTLYLNGNTVHDYAFAYCDKLSNVYYGSGISTLGNYAFYRCTSLPAQAISNVTTIGSYAYAYCSSMTSVQLSSAVLSVGNYAFSYDGALANVVSLATSPPNGGTSMFYESPQLAAIHVPSVAAQASYRAAVGWSTYSGIIVTP